MTVKTEVAMVESCFTDCLSFSHFLTAYTIHALNINLGFIKFVQETLMAYMTKMVSIISIPNDACDPIFKRMKRMSLECPLDEGMMIMRGVH